MLPLSTYTPDNGAHFALSALIWASKARRPWDPHNHVLASSPKFASLLCFHECLIAICIFFDPEKISVLQVSLAFVQYGRAKMIEAKKKKDVKSDRDKPKNGNLPR